MWLGIATGAAAAVALGIPFFAKQIPWTWEGALARQWRPFPNDHLCQLPQPATFALQKVVNRLVPVYPNDDFPVHVQIVRHDTINAFATLHGEIFVFQGLLNQTQSADELAGVLAHEIEHVKRRHIVQGAFTRLLTVGIFSMVFQDGRLDARTAEQLLHMKFSRLQESEADAGGFRRLHDAKVSTDGVENFFNRMETMSSTPTILSDHPASAERATLAKKFKPKNPAPILTTSEWLALRNACR